jgi:hypothetical protein
MCVHFVDVEGLLAWDSTLTCSVSSIVQILYSHRHGERYLFIFVVPCGRQWAVSVPHPNFAKLQRGLIHRGRQDRVSTYMHKAQACNRPHQTLDCLTGPGLSMLTNCTWRLFEVLSLLSSFSNITDEWGDSSPFPQSWDAACVQNNCGGSL